MGLLDHARDRVRPSLLDFLFAAPQVLFLFSTFRKPTSKPKLLKASSPGGEARLPTTLPPRCTYRCPTPYKQPAAQTVKGCEYRGPLISATSWGGGSRSTQCLTGRAQPTPAPTTEVAHQPHLGEYSVSRADSSRLQTTDLARFCRCIWDPHSNVPPSLL